VFVRRDRRHSCSLNFIGGGTSSDKRPDGHRAFKSMNGRRFAPNFGLPRTFVKREAMTTALHHTFTPMPTAFERVVDLTRGVVVGWDVRPRDQTAPMPPHGAGQLVSAALAARGDLSSGEFVSVRIPRAAGTLRTQLIGAGPLDGLAIILVGETSQDGHSLLEWARERGALVGCDGAAQLSDVAVLRPDLLAMSTASGHQKLRALARIAWHVGARALADGVSSLQRASVLATLDVALAQGPAFGSPTRALETQSREVAAPTVQRTSHQLADPTPSVMTTEPLSELVRRCLADEGSDWVTVVDDESRPVRLIERASLLRGEPFEHRAFTVDQTMSVREMARAASRRPRRDRPRPLALCNPQGQYVGLLRVERLLDALAA
jgi:hypothetical protein